MNPKPSLIVSVSILVRDYESQRCIRISPASDDMDRWCLALCMFDRNLLETLSLESLSTPLNIQLRRVASPTMKQLTGAWDVPTHTVLNVPPNVSAYWCNFYLQYCRDGIADVDHIDNDAELKGKCAHPSDNTFIFTVPKARPPLMPDEVKRRLGD